MISERVRTAIEIYSFSGINGRRVTVSLGISTMEPGDSDVSLIHRADENLY